MKFLLGLHREAGNERAGQGSPSQCYARLLECIEGVYDDYGGSPKITKILISETKCEDVSARPYFRGWKAICMDD